MKYAIHTLLVLGIVSICLLFSLRAAQADKGEEITLKEGDLVSSHAYDGDPDIFVINEHGHKRLFLNPAIFGFYGHLTYAKVIQIPPSVKDEFKTSSFYRNCEEHDEKVYALKTSDEDEGELHHIDATEQEVTAQDADFSQEIFCINKKEFNWYRKALKYNSLSFVVPYVRPHYPLIKVDAPNGGELWQKGTSETIRWSTPLPTPGERSNISSVDITLIGWTEPCRIFPCAMEKPQIFPRAYRIATDEPNDGVFEWTVAKNIEGVEVPQGRYLIQICRAGTRACDISDALFSIVADNITPSLMVISPNGQEIWERETKKEIQWRGAKSSVDIYLLRGDYPICVSHACPLIGWPDVSYLIARNASSTPFIWIVGSDANGNTIPNGKYAVRVVASDGAYDQSDAPFSIVAKSQNNLPPVMHGVSGPTSLTVGEIGTWTIQASDPENGVLTYSVVWGDETVRANEASPAPSSDAIKQTATFTHSYANAGKYEPRFIVTDNQGLSAKTSISLTVTGTAIPSITVLSPNGGESWLKGNSYTISWKNNSFSDNVYIDLLNENNFAVHFIASNITNTGSYTWTLPTALTAGSYNLRVTNKEGSVKDESDAPFSITTPAGY